MSEQGETVKVDAAALRDLYSMHGIPAVNEAVEHLRKQGVSEKKISKMLSKAGVVDLRKAKVVRLDEGKDLQKSDCPSIRERETVELEPGVASEKASHEKGEEAKEEAEAVDDVSEAEEPQAAPAPDPHVEVQIVFAGNDPKAKRDALLELTDARKNDAITDEDFAVLAQCYGSALNKSACPCGGGEVFERCCRPIWLTVRRTYQGRDERMKAAAKRAVREAQQGETQWVLRLGVNQGSGIVVEAMKPGVNQFFTMDVLFKGFLETLLQTCGIIARNEAAASVAAAIKLAEDEEPDNIVKIN